MVACIFACLVLLVRCHGTAQSVLSGGIVVRVHHDVPDHYAGPQNPSGAIFRDGSSDQSVGCPQLRGEWEMHSVAVLQLSLVPLQGIA